MLSASEIPQKIADDREIHTLNIPLLFIGTGSCEIKLKSIQLVILGIKWSLCNYSTLLNPISHTKDKKNIYMYIYILSVVSWIYVQFSRLQWDLFLR